MKPWRIFMASIWLVNGLICKVLNLVPRHEAIVSRIVGEDHAFLFTKLIGIGEILMAIWIVSCMYRRLNAVIQMILILVMNGIEFILAPDLLLWGKMNLVFALLFIVLIGWMEFGYRRTSLPTS